MMSSQRPGPNQTPQVPLSVPIPSREKAWYERKLGIALGLLFVVGTSVLSILLPAYNEKQERLRQVIKKSDRVRDLLSVIVVDLNDFHSRAGFYTTDMRLISPGVLENLTYKVGFSKASEHIPEELRTGSEHTRHGELDPSMKDSDLVGASYDSETTSLRFADIATKYCQDCTAGKDTFTLMAIANLDDDPTLDVWTMNERWQHVHISDDAAD